jgi:pSer/pThr/pTyr-binding forkhead associated (FHA) protein
MHVLVILSGPRAGERIDISGELVVGRENADVVIADDELSRRHLALRPRDGSVEVEDLGSTNGSFLDGTRIDAPMQLDSTTRLRVGDTDIEVEIEPLGDPGATRVRQSPVSEATVVGRAVPAAPAPAPEPAPPARPLAPAVPAVPAGNGAPSALPAFGELTPKRGGGGARRGGIATRQAAPALFTIALIVAVAIALVVYFGAR